MSFQNLPDNFDTSENRKSKILILLLVIILILVLCFIFRAPITNLISGGGDPDGEDSNLLQRLISQLGGTITEEKDPVINVSGDIIYEESVLGEFPETGEVEDVWVDTSGDTMTGDLNLENDSNISINSISLDERGSQNSGASLIGVYDNLIHSSNQNVQSVIYDIDQAIQDLENTVNNIVISNTERDPIFTSSVAHGITALNVSNWNTAYGHSQQTSNAHGLTYTAEGHSGGLDADTIDGYHASDLIAGIGIENDPVFSSSPVAGITATDIVNWDLAFSWGNHNTMGYLTSELDPLFSVSPAASITLTDIANWDIAYNHAQQTSNVHGLTYSSEGHGGGLDADTLDGLHASDFLTTSFTEIDPVYSTSPAGTITNTDINNWDLAYSWGNHALAGYLTSESDPLFSASPAAGITGIDIAQWDSAYAHSVQTSNVHGLTYTSEGHGGGLDTDTLDGYHASDFLTSSFTELDPIFTTSPAGSITNTDITNWNTAFGWGDHASAGYLTSETDPVWIAAEPNYFNLTENETVTGRPNFNGGDASTAPFTVDSTYLVTNLNADLLDGYHASDFMLASTDNWINDTGDTITGTLNFSGVTNDITTGTNQHLAIIPGGTGHVGIGTTTPTNAMLQVEGVGTHAIYGISTTNIGVVGESVSDAGVLGYSENATGVHGFSNTGIGVRGSSSSNYSGYFDGGLGVVIFGNLTVTGSKSGYVVDIASNAGTRQLTRGDIVMVTQNSTEFFDNIPIAKVEKSTKAQNSQTMGVVDKKVTGITGQYQNQLNDKPQFSEQPIGFSEYTSVVTLGAFEYAKVMVTLNNTLNAGDKITISPISGVGGEAMVPTYVVGEALAGTSQWSASVCSTVPNYNSIPWNSDSNSATKRCYAVPVNSFDANTQQQLAQGYGVSGGDFIYTGKIEIFVHPSWYEPEEYLAKLAEIIQDYEASITVGNSGSEMNTPVGETLSTTQGIFSTIDADEINVAGNITIGGLISTDEIATRLISSYNQQDIVFKLSESLGQTALAIKNGLGETVFSVDSTGKISIRSDTQDSSVGTSHISVNETEVKITTSVVNAGSKVFVTPRANGSDIPTLAIQEISDDFFIVKMDKKRQVEVEFDWWIIN